MHCDSPTVFRVPVFPSGRRFGGQLCSPSEIRSADPVWFCGTRGELLVVAEALGWTRDRFSVECSKSIRSVVSPLPHDPVAPGCPDYPEGFPCSVRSGLLVGSYIQS